MSALKDNTTGLQEVLAKAKSLPSGGSGEPVELQEKTVTPTKSAQRVVSDSGYGGLSAVNVEPIPDEYIVPSDTMEITENGDYGVREYEYVHVNVDLGGTPWFYDVPDDRWYDNSDGSYGDPPDYDNMARPAGRRYFHDRI